MYGTQTNLVFASSTVLFENDVEMYGTQTANAVWLSRSGLRMM